jgi:D-beta-D-heptose 7-phosphate kinase/D-beta-D-heptose 1-phosphate adenosyltransferase
MRVTGMLVNDEAGLDRAADKIIQDIENKFLLVTRGAEGMTLYGRQGRVTHEKAHALNVFDVTGAGDTAVALFGLAYFAGASPEKITRLANLAAGIVVGKVGTSTVSLSELQNASLTGKQGTIGNILDLEDLLSRLRHERAKGRVVVFTNGCFDLLHVGHIQYLQQARQLGDLLVVGLNDDASVYRIKGESRPLIEEKQRAQLLAALACVDFVTFFREDTPKNLIEQVRPDILVKGGNYETGEVVGRDFVESFGGRVEVLPFIEGISTSDIVGTILERYAPGRENV